MSTKVDKQLLINLRRETLAPFKDCIEALLNTSNNLEEARKFLIKKSVKNLSPDYKYDCILTEGRVHIGECEPEKLVYIFSLVTETDFNSNSSYFRDLQGSIDQILRENVFFLTKNWKNWKMDDILNLRSENSGLSIGEQISSCSSVVREVIKMDDFWVFKMAGEEMLLRYLHHNFKLGAVLIVRRALEVEDFSLEDYSEIRKLIIHYSSANTLFLRREDIPSNWLDEKKKEILENLGDKAKNIFNLEKVIGTQLNKLISESTFEDQKFILDSSISIRSLLQKYNLELVEAKKIVI